LLDGLAVRQDLVHVELTGRLPEKEMQRAFVLARLLVPRPGAQAGLAAPAQAPVLAPADAPAGARPSAAVQQSVGIAPSPPVVAGTAAAPQQDGSAAPQQ